MKILHLIPSLRKGGAERIALDICVALMQEGHDVKLVTLYSDNQYKFISDKLDYQHINTSISLSLLRKNQIDVTALQSIIDSFQPDVIHSHLFEAEINLAFCQFPEGMKRVIQFHDNMVQMKTLSWGSFLKKSSLTNYYERHLILKKLPKQTIAIGISKNSLEYVKTMLPSRIDCILLPNAIDLSRFKQSTVSIKNNHLIMIGSLIDLKGQELAIRTIAELNKRNIPIFMTLVGDGPNAHQLKELTKTLQIESLVEFTGFVDFPESLLQNASIYIHTSYSEAFGLVIVEAMACGLPVVCTDAIGNRDLILEGENGFMVRERDPKLLADKIELLLQNDALRSEMSGKARGFAQNFGIENYVDQLLIIYKS
jgi:glycosyltransferase involved in cell wall biosynthesis